MSEDLNTPLDHLLQDAFRVILDNLDDWHILAEHSTDSPQAYREYLFTRMLKSLNAVRHSYKSLQESNKGQSHQLNDYRNKVARFLNRQDTIEELASGFAMWNHRKDRQGCSLDNDGDGNCSKHPLGCVAALEREVYNLQQSVEFSERYRPLIAELLGMRGSAHWGDIKVVLEGRLAKKETTTNHHRLVIGDRVDVEIPITIDGGAVEALGGVLDMVDLCPLGEHLVLKLRKDNWLRRDNEWRPLT